MSYLLDTNVVSELRRRTPDPAVSAWFRTASADELHLSVLVIGEIRRGIERLRPREQQRAAALDAWLEGLHRGFTGRILPISAAIADRWGRMNAGNPLPVVDGLLAATAIEHSLTLVTRDTRRLARTDVRLLDPFAA